MAGNHFEFQQNVHSVIDNMKRVLDVDLATQSEATRMKVDLAITAVSRHSLIAVIVLTNFV